MRGEIVYKLPERPCSGNRGRAQRLVQIFDKVTSLRIREEIQGNENPPEYYLQAQAFLRELSKTWLMQTRQLRRGRIGVYGL